MATGDSNDQIGRLKKLLPPWFGDVFPLVTAILSGIAAVNSFLYELVGFAKFQTRIRTATDGWLDLIAADFFGTAIRRTTGQSDASLRNTIITNIFRERATRRGLSQVLFDLTGRAPIIFEPERVQDTGGYDGPTIGYGVAGHYGSTELPFQAFVTAFRPLTSGIPYVAGYGTTPFGYSVASRGEYASLGMIETGVSDAEIYAAIDGVKPAGTIVWTRISA